MAHLLLAHKKLHAGEDGIGPAPSDGAVAAAARASASREIATSFAFFIDSSVDGTVLYPDYGSSEYRILRAHLALIYAHYLHDRLISVSRRLRLL